MGQMEQTVCKQMTDVKLWLFYSNTWNDLTVCKQKSNVKLRLLHCDVWNLKSSGSFENGIY